MNTRSTRVHLPWPALAAAALLLVWLSACSEPTPVSFPMRSVLPFGSLGMVVDNTEVTEKENKNSILVHVSISQFDDPGQARVASESWQRWFWLVDGAGNRYKCKYILPSNYYYRKLSEKNSNGVRSWGQTWADETTNTPPREWILLFQTPADTRGFTMIVDNESFGNRGQPLRIAVPLDR